MKSFVYVGLFLLFVITGFIFRNGSGDTDWAEYHGDAARSHYSPLFEINRENVSKLKVAWTYASGGADTLRNRTQIQCNPIIIRGVLYGVSANTQAFAIEAATGKELWKTELTENEGSISRGVTYWTDNREERIFLGAGKWLYAIDAKTGKLIASFGQNGRIFLKDGIERPGADDYVTSNTPNTIYNRFAWGHSRLRCKIR
jgi:quinoprotein glucose dehydrogenase